MTARPVKNPSQLPNSATKERNEYEYEEVMVETTFGKKNVNVRLATNLS